MIKDYAREPKIGADVTRRPMSAIVLIVFALVLLTAVTLILLSLNPDQRIEGSPTVQVEPVIPIVTPEPVKIILTEKTTTPDFTYSIILKQTEVKPAHVKVYESTPKDPTKKTSHVLQVASFKSELDAKELQNKLIKKKLANVQVTQPTTESGTVWFRVMVGPFQNRSMLNKLVQIHYSLLMQ